jgi:hypothetical protein
MKKNRSKRKAAKPPGARRKGQGPGATLIASSLRPALAAEYKVVELTTVDEISLETALNDWVRRGWRLDSIQFAMRDSSRRPAMAFVLFTRLSEQKVAPDSINSVGRNASNLATVQPLPDPHVSSDPWRRLRQLAGIETEDPESGEPSSE